MLVVYQFVAMEMLLISDVELYTVVPMLSPAKYQAAVKSGYGELWTMTVALDSQLWEWIHWICLQFWIATEKYTNILPLFVDLDVVASSSFAMFWHLSAFARTDFPVYHDQSSLLTMKS